MKALMINQKKSQMDFIIKLFDTETKTFATRYYFSKCLSDSSPKTLTKYFHKAFEKLDKKIQVAMDGRNVNWALFKIIKEERKVEKIPLLISIESCALYIFED